MTFALGGFKQAVIRDQLKALLADAEVLSFAVSYIQLSGWELLKPMISTDPRQVRILCTDQLGITDPEAVRRLMEAGFRVHAYSDLSLFHPKVFIATNSKGEEHFLLGSANLSRSALITGVEATFGGQDATGALTAWFDNMFNEPAKSVPFDEERLTNLEASHTARLKSRLAYKRALPVVNSNTGNTAEEDAVEFAFASLDGDPLPLNMDKAGNTVRNLGYVQRLVTGAQAQSVKAAGELKQLGFYLNGALTTLGIEAREADTLDEIAAAWVRWLKAETTTELMRLNPTGKLKRAREIFDTFWSMPSPITTYFLDNAEGPSAEVRPLLQTIELLANTRRRWPTLTLDDIHTLAGILQADHGLPVKAQQAVASYLNNKGTRGWGEPDRRIVLQAWRDNP